MLARTDGSAMLNRTDVIVSVEVGNVRFETGALLRKEILIWKEIRKQKKYFVSSHICTVLEAVAKRGSVRWWSIELERVNFRTDYPGGCGTYLKAALPGKTFNGWKRNKVYHQSKQKQALGHARSVV